MARLGNLAGDGILGEALCRFYCLSVWVAAPFAGWVGKTWMERLLLWPAVSGAAILLERATAPHQPFYSEDLPETTKGHIT